MLSLENGAAMVTEYTDGHSALKSLVVSGQLLTYVFDGEVLVLTFPDGKTLEVSEHYGSLIVLGGGT